MFKLLRKLYDWMGSKVHTPYAIVWLATLFFIEALFFVPVDPLLVLFCVSNQKKSLRYASIATIFSVLGGIVGYCIGAWAWQSICTQLVSWLISENTFFYLTQKYQLYQNWAVLIAGFTPLPYKAITLSAGFCHLSFIPFVLCSLIARGARFFLIAGMIKIWGIQMKIFIDRYFNQLVVLFSLLVAISLWAALY